METFDWHYIGRFGQLGPLSVDQMRELIRDEVIQADTYVWKNGMGDWQRAGSVSEFSSGFVGTQAPMMPPPTPGSPTIPPPQLPNHNPSNLVHRPPYHQNAMAMVPVSSRSRVAGGVLNLLFPGIGRMYLGYVGTGLLQFFTTLCFGLGYLWSFVDGVLMLTGSVKTDGLGRPLKD